MTLVNFTPIPALTGGVLVGLAASLMLLLNGRITGISGILGQILMPRKGDVLWRVVFILGLLGGGLLLAVLPYSFFPSAALWSGGHIGKTLLAGLLVGLGTRLGGGCTSGHGICGVGRFSKRSILAVLTFMVSGSITVYFFHS